jgi:hypothetical protein
MSSMSAQEFALNPAAQASMMDRKITELIPRIGACANVLFGMAR